MGFTDDLPNWISSAVQSFSLIPEPIKVLILIMMAIFTIWLINQGIGVIEATTGQMIKPYLSIGGNVSGMNCIKSGEGCLASCDYSKMPECSVSSDANFIIKAGKACVAIEKRALITKEPELSSYLQKEYLGADCGVEWYYKQKRVPDTSLLSNILRLTNVVKGNNFTYDDGAETTWFYVLPELPATGGSTAANIQVGSSTINLNREWTICHIAAATCNSRVQDLLALARPDDNSNMFNRSASFNKGVSCNGYSNRDTTIGNGTDIGMGGGQLRGIMAYEDDLASWERSCYKGGLYLLDEKLWAFVPMMFYITMFALKYYGVFFKAF